LNLLAADKRAHLLIHVGRKKEAISLSSAFYQGFAPWLVALYVSHAAVAAEDVALASDQFIAAIRTYPDPPVGSHIGALQLVEVADSLGIRAIVEDRLGLISGDIALDPAEAHISAFMTTDSDDRLRRLRAGHAMAPDRPMLSADLAMQEVFSGNRQEAIALARHVVSCGTESAVPIAYAGRVLFMAGAPPEETLAVADKALGLAEGAGASAWTAQHVKAESLNALGRFNEAIQVGQQALESHAVPITVMAVLRSLQGLGQSAEALELARKALTQFPDDIELKSWMALLLNLAGCDKECVKLVRGMGATSAIMITPLLDMADCLLRGQRYDRALTCYRSARKNLESLHDRGTLDDFYVRAVGGEVNALTLQGKKRAALQILSGLGDGYLVTTHLWLLKSALCLELKRPADGLSLADARAQVAPSDPNAAFYRAQHLQQSRSLSEALAAVEEATALAGKETPQSLDLKARILGDMSRFDEAMNLLLREMELQAASKETVSLGGVMLAAQWLQKCHPVPLLGLKMAAAWFGTVSSEKGRSTEAGKLLRTLVSLDWTVARKAAEAGDYESKLALAIMQKARSRLGQRFQASSANEKPSARADESQQTPTVLESLLRHLLQAEWSQSPRTRKNPKPTRRMR